MIFQAEWNSNGKTMSDPSEHQLSRSVLGSILTRATRIAAIWLLITVLPGSLRAEAGCKVRWENIAKILRTNDAQSLGRMTEWRPLEPAVIEETPEWLAYGMRLWEFGDRKKAALILAPRVPIDRDGWSCMNALFNRMNASDDGNEAGFPMTEDELRRLGRFLFEVILNPRVLFMTADADLLDRGFRVYLQHFDGEWGEALSGGDEEFGEGPCAPDTVQARDICTAKPYRQAVVRALARLTAGERARLKAEKDFAPCFSTAKRIPRKK